MADIKGTMSLDATGVSAGIKKAEKDVESSTSRMVKMIAGAFTIGKALSFANEALEAAGEMADLADKMGLPIRTIQILRNVAAGADVDFAVMEKAVYNINNALGEARGGSEAAWKKFEALGISWDSISSAGYDTSAAIRDVAKASEEATQGTERYAAATDMLGGVRSSKAIASLKTLSKALSDTRAAEATGPIISDAAAERSEAFHRAKVMGKIKAQALIVQGLTPDLTIKEAFSKSKPEHVPVPEVNAVPQPNPEPLPISVPVAVPEVTAAPVANPVQDSISVPVAVPEVIASPVANAVPDVVSVPVAVPEVIATPVTSHVPNSISVPVSIPEVTATPVAYPVPDSISVDVPVPEVVAHPVVSNQSTQPVYVDVPVPSVIANLPQVKPEQVAYVPTPSPTAPPAQGIGSLTHKAVADMADAILELDRIKDGTKNFAENMNLAERLSRKRDLEAAAKTRAQTLVQSIITPGFNDRLAAASSEFEARASAISKMNPTEQKLQQKANDELISLIEKIQNESDKILTDQREREAKIMEDVSVSPIAGDQLSRIGGFVGGQVNPAMTVAQRQLEVNKQILQVQKDTKEAIDKISLGGYQ